MKRFIVFLTLVCMGALASMAVAGDYHTTTTLICSDCHNMHSSITHSYNNGGTQKDVVTYPFTSTGHEYLLFGTVNETCLNCHDNSASGPDVFGVNTGMYSGSTRLAGGLNGTVSAHTPGGSYSDNTGHTLGSTATPPGSSGLYVPGLEGLECTTCHAQHGSTTQYRNLLSRGLFGAPNAAKAVTYEVGANATSPQTKDVLERSAVLNNAAHYAYANVDYEEPYADSSRYANWCKTCHTNFHGTAGAGELGGSYGGYKNSSTSPWLRHPTNGVNLGGTPTFVASLTTYAGRTNKVHMMDSQGLWTGAAADTTLTPSCFSCHKAHGNENPFGLMFMNGTGTITDNGDGGVYKDLCKQCHTQG